MASKVPYNKVFDVFKAGRDADKSTGETISVLILLGDDIDKEHVSALRDAFLAQRSGGLVSVRPLSDPTAPDAPFDIAIVVPGSQDIDDLKRAVAQLASRGTPCAIIQATSLEQIDFSYLGYQDYEPTFIAATDGEAMLDKLAKWIVETSEKGRTFAANFPFIRPAEVKYLITGCAVRNATVGAVDVLHGADLPIMTANQAKLALDIAASYGKGLTLARVPEMAAVVGAGFAYRELARAIGKLLPGMGWATRAGLGYAGTVATGNALKAYFELKENPKLSMDTTLVKRPSLLQNV